MPMPPHSDRARGAATLAAPGPRGGVTSSLYTLACRSGSPPFGVHLSLVFEWKSNFRLFPSQTIPQRRQSCRAPSLTRKSDPTEFTPQELTIRYGDAQFPALQNSNPCLFQPSLHSPCKKKTRR